MKKYLLPIVIACAAAFSCSVKKTQVTQLPVSFDFEAHRGGRGLMPENTIPAMINAIGMERVKTLEMDVVISKDGQVVVSHDPYFNAAITTTPEGKTITPAEGQKLILYQLNYDEIKKYDVGIKPHPDFPLQQKLAVNKPLLADLLAATEKEADKRNRKIYYNIEVKSKKTTDNTHHPEPEVFVDKLVSILQKGQVLERTVVQSFDVRPLQVLHKKYPGIKTSFLVDKDGGDVERMLNTLGFTPTIYSPVYTIVTPTLVAECHKRNIRVVPWTVNTKEELQRQVDMNIDGIISDFPNLFDAVKIK